MINLKNLSKIDSFILFLLSIAVVGIIVVFSQIYCKPLFNNSYNKEYIVIEKTESIKLMYNIIQVQDHLIQLLLEQNKRYDYYLGITKEQIDKIEKKKVK